MELRSSIQSLAFGDSVGSWRTWPSNVDSGRCRTRVHFPVCQVNSVSELSPKELHHMRKKEAWKKKRRVRRLEKLAGQTRLQEMETRKNGQERRRSVGLTSFEKYKFEKEKVNVHREPWRSGRKGKTTLMSKFEEDFARRVRDAVSLIKPSNSICVENDEDELGHNSTRFRQDSHAVLQGSLEDIGDESDGGSLEIQRKVGSPDKVVRSDSLPKFDKCLRNGRSMEEVSAAVVKQDETLESHIAGHSSTRTDMQFIHNSYFIPIEWTSTSARMDKNSRSSLLRSKDDKDAGTASDDTFNQKFSLDRHDIRDWRVKPKTPRLKDKVVGQLIIDRRKGEPLSTLLDDRSKYIPLETRSALEAVREDVDTDVWRKPVVEREQLEWLVEQLTEVNKKQKVFLSRLMHGARLKWTESRLLELVKMLGERRDWRRAMEVVHWVHCREHFKHCRSRHVCTTLLAVLGKCLRPVEAVNVFNIMREEHSTYPDMAAYHSIAVTLGQAGQLTELLDLIESLREGPKKKLVNGKPKYLIWDGRLEPDIVVYNAGVQIINACGPHREWQGTEWVLQQMKSQGINPNSTTYGLAIEVMVKSGQYLKAWRYYELLERGGFLPNALTFKALVEALGTAGETDKALEMVEDMERRGVLDCAGVYYALASALCAAGRLSEALIQVEKLLELPSKKPEVVTFTGLIRTCEKAGRWRDAISLFNRMQYACAPNVGTYNIMIALYGRHRLFEEAKGLYEAVKRGKHKESKPSEACPRLSPTAHTYESMLGACAACEEWEYFESVLHEFVTRGFQLDCKRHAWYISPLVKAGQEDLVHLMTRHLQRPDVPPTANLYSVLLPSLYVHGRYTMVVHYLNVALEQGVALDTPVWASILGNALEQLPMVDAERFICTKVTSDEVGDELVKQLLNCLVSVGAKTKAKRLVSLLGLEVGDFLPVTNVTVGDLRLLPQE